ncbi:ImmA/IrrE family metallo-endopeptidase [Rothia sp. CCM 9417]|uniref:ImmA/IrrE family metallo-endopeptidase n=1 Tax=Rothia sp. CCM 9417 TaxID=3402657 RepID=UPI003AE06454
MKSTTTHTTSAQEYAKALGLPIYYDDLTPRLRGLYLPQSNCIFLRPDQHPHMENWVLWHEIGHYHTRSSHIASRKDRNSIEQRCDRYAAIQSLPLGLLCNKDLYSPDLAQWAYNLRTPPRALKTRLQYLTFNEKMLLPEQIKI